MESNDTESTRSNEHVSARPRWMDHVADTRDGLIEAARKLFTERGYADTSTDEIVRLARASKGALYHHFSGKEQLFSEVLERVESGFIERLAATPVPGDNVWEEIGYGCQAFLDVALDPEVQRIVLIDGPSVLGWEAWREIEERHGFGLLKHYLGLAIEAGFLPPQPVDPLVHLLSGALNEAAIYIAHSADRRRARSEMGAALAGVLTSVGRAGASNRESLVSLDLTAAETANVEG
jgi:AcrR family transcriptional regulator